jgi:hypothetical protein
VNSDGGSDGAISSNVTLFGGTRECHIRKLGLSWGAAMTTMTMVWAQEHGCRHRVLAAVQLPVPVPARDPTAHSDPGPG